MSQIGVKPGEFPYPLIDGPDESRYLTWVRNHANYLANRGFLDYLRIVAVLIRGILINFLTVIPLQLVGALLLAICYKNLLRDWAGTIAGPDGRLTEAAQGFFLTHPAEAAGRAKWMQDHLHTEAPYILTPWFALAALVWFLLFPMVIRLFKVIAHKKSTQTGNESSVKLRDKYERSFSAALIILAVMAIIESLPLIIHQFHQFREYRQSVGGWREVIALGAGGSSIVILSGAGKVLSLLGDAKRKLVMPVLALLGMLLPLLVVLYVTEYLVYKTKMITLDWRYLLALPTILAAGIILTLVLSLKRQKSAGWLLGLLGIVVACAAILVFFAGRIPSHEWFFVVAITIEVWLFSWLAIDINLTSVHGMYRDRLATAFLVGRDTRGDVDIEEDIDLHHICRYDQGSTAPYHLVNVALNLQSSTNIDIRERNCDFFIFSKKFIGGNSTGYCRSETIEQVFPQMDLATAMAISAAAASPNMGRSTQAPMVALMTLFNIRLGYWVPNPGRLEVDRGNLPASEPGPKTPPPGYPFSHVFDKELGEIESRWSNAYPEGIERQPSPDTRLPTPAHGLVGLAFSGGGIRSATVNLGITQALDQAGVFNHVDFMSTVSGGGYLGSSISTLMRSKEELPEDPPLNPGTLKERFSWRVRPSAFLREMRCKLDEKHHWVNLSDGGHIENLASIELLRRRCKYILIGDGEADFEMKFNGLATLVRFARIDLGIHIDIDLNALRLEDGRSQAHFVHGWIYYPQCEERGQLVYLKSSLTGDEDVVIKEYSANNETFPHESTADQFFDEGQFEAYRALGEHIGKSAVAGSPDGIHRFTDLEAWFEALANPETANPETAMPET